MNFLKKVGYQVVIPGKGYRGVYEDYRTAEQIALLAYLVEGTPGMVGTVFMWRWQPYGTAKNEQPRNATISGQFVEEAEGNISQIQGTGTESREHDIGGS